MVTQSIQLTPWLVEISMQTIEEPKDQATFLVWPTKILNLFFAVCQGLCIKFSDWHLQIFKDKSWFWIILLIQADKKRWPNLVLMLDHRLRRWPNIKTTVGQSLVLAGLTKMCSLLAFGCGVKGIHYSHLAAKTKTLREINCPCGMRVVHWKYFRMSAENCCLQFESKLGQSMAKNQSVSIPTIIHCCNRRKVIESTASPSTR